MKSPGLALKRHEVRAHFREARDDSRIEVEGRSHHGRRRMCKLFAESQSKQFRLSWWQYSSLPRAATEPKYRDYKPTCGIVTAFRACGHASGRVAKTMQKISYDRYRFQPEIIQQAIWPYLRFTLSFRNVGDLSAERGIAVSYETIRRWVNHFGPMIAADLSKRCPGPCTIWHLDEVHLKIADRMVYL
jgi:hypothetical protein